MNDKREPNALNSDQQQGGPVPPSVKENGDNDNLHGDGDENSNIAGDSEDGPVVPPVQANDDDDNVNLPNDGDNKKKGARDCETGPAPPSGADRLAGLLVAADEAIKRLLNEAGLDLNAVNLHGQKPIEVAAANGNRRGVEILFP